MRLKCWTDHGGAQAVLDEDRQLLAQRFSAAEKRNRHLVGIAL